MHKGLFRGKTSYTTVTTFLAGWLLIVVLLEFFASQRWLYILLLPLLLLGVHYHKQLRSFWLIALEGIYFGVITWNFYKIYQIIAINYFNPPEWDFLAFWLDGRIANQHLNFYLASSYQGFELPVSVSHEFTRSILEVGFRYPPPTMLLFLPLGWFDSLNSAYLIWQLFMVAVLVINIFLLWKLLLIKSRALGLLASGALILLLPPTHLTLYLAQTNFIALLALLVFLIYPQNLLGGIWLGIGMVVKPFIGLFFLLSAIQRRWQVASGIIITYGFLSIIFIVIFDMITFMSFFAERPPLKMPDYVYIEDINQSLLAHILRLTDHNFGEAQLMLNPIFIALSLFLLTTTGVLAFYLKSNDSIWAFSLTLLTALLVYPKTLVHYSVLLIIPMLVLWKYRNRWAGGLWSSMFVITLTYLLLHSDWNYTFAVTLLYWFIFAAFGAQLAFVRSGKHSRANLLSNKFQN